MEGLQQQIYEWQGPTGGGTGTSLWMACGSEKPGMRQVRPLLSAPALTPKHPWKVGTPVGRQTAVTVMRKCCC